MKRSPDVVIGIDYLDRWYLVPRNRWLNVYLHRFRGSDDDRALHDHPWWSLSFLLAGHMVEHYRTDARDPVLQRERWVPWLFPVLRSARFAHRLEVVEGPVWTLFITGPRVREWGFFCPAGWRHWSAFTDPSGNRIGRGCE